MEQLAQQADNKAGKGIGVLAGVMTFLTSNAIALPVDAMLIQAVVACVSGIFYWLTSVSVTWLREAYRERRERRSLKEPAKSE